MFFKEIEKYKATSVFSDVHLYNDRDQFKALF